MKKYKLTRNPAPTKKTPPKKNNNFLIIYSLALFIFAASIVGLSYLGNQKAQERVEQQFKDSQQVALEALKRSDDMSDDIERLSGQLTAANLMTDELQEQLQKFQSDNSELSEHLRALQSDGAKKDQKIAELEEKIKELESEGTTSTTEE